MVRRRASTERFGSFSGAVLAVIITIVVRLIRTGNWAATTDFPHRHIFHGFFSCDSDLTKASR